MPKPQAQNLKPQTFDFHTHTNYQDGKNTSREMTEVAIQNGLKIYGISEHHPRPPEFRYFNDPPNEIRGLSRWPKFLAEMQTLKKEFSPKIELLLASEFDWLGKDNLATWQKWHKEANFDYVIGSVHFLGKWGFDYQKDWDKGKQKFNSIEAIYEKYFAEVAEMINSGAEFFDIVGHLDLIKKFVKNSPNTLPFVLPVLDAMAKTDLVLEINTAGLEKFCAEQYPSLEILRAAREREIPITINSDAHETCQIAKYFEQGKKLAQNTGYDAIEVFHTNGNKETITILNKF